MTCVMKTMSERWRLVQCLLASVDETALGKVKPFDKHKLENSLKFIKVFQKNTSGIFEEDHWYI
jgi:hypothetical protein